MIASLVVGVLSMTGLGVKITSGIFNDMLWPALLLTALACLILGMEVPTTAAYVICVSVAGPALISLGLEPLLAHLFVFWYALLSTITPPVSGGVFIAAGMVANPAMIQLAFNPSAAVLDALKVAIGLGAISYGVIARKALWQRSALIVGGIILIFVV